MLKIMLIKRLPSLIYNHLYFGVFLICSFISVTYLLISWGIVCTRWEPKHHVNLLCKAYNDHKVTGDMCDALCTRKSITPFNCYGFHAGKEAVFSAIDSKENHIMIKSPEKTATKTTDGHNSDDFLLFLENNNNHENEKKFINMIKQHTSVKLNISITDEQAERLSNFKGPNRTSNRNIEMRDIWNLLQTNEYIMSILYEDLDLFPKVLGSCGRYFMMEYLQPAMEEEISKALSMNDSEENWRTRLKLSLLLLDLIDQIDSENLLLCDVKPSHFGLSLANGKMKILDVDTIFPRSIANRLVRNDAKCLEDEQCSFFDCKSACRNKVCSVGVTTSNLQIICAKLFLGGEIKNSGLVIPGLLNTHFTPLPLASVLRRCSQYPPSGELKADLLNILQSLLSKFDENEI